MEIDAKTATVARRWSDGAVQTAGVDGHRHRASPALQRLPQRCSWPSPTIRSGKVRRDSPIGAGVDGAGFDPASGDVFASNADGTLTVIHQDSPDSYRVVQTVETPQGSRNMGLDPANHRIFVAAAKFGEAAGGRGRRPVVSDTFELLVIEKRGAVDEARRKLRRSNKWGRSILGVLTGLAIVAVSAVAQEPASTGPYKVLKTAKVGGLGGFDYIQADADRRRLYIPRGAVQGDQPLPGRVTIFDLDKLSPRGRHSEYKSQRGSRRRQVRPWLRQQQSRGLCGISKSRP